VTWTKYGWYSVSAGDEGPFIFAQQLGSRPRGLNRAKSLFRGARRLDGSATTHSGAEVARDARGARQRTWQDSDHSGGSRPAARSIKHQYKLIDYFRVSLAAARFFFHPSIAATPDLAAAVLSLLPVSVVTRACAGCGFRLVLPSASFLLGRRV